MDSFNPNKSYLILVILVGQTYYVYEFVKRTKSEKYLDTQCTNFIMIPEIDR